MSRTPVSVISPTLHPARWPHQQLDVPGLRAGGWQPTPFREFVLKVHQRCNLACDYCYVYELADQSYRDRPRMMAPATWRAAAGRIVEHVRAHELTSVTVILHGGEPLLAGPDRLLRLIDDVRIAMPPSCAVSVGMQTNGVRLDEPALSRLMAAGVRIGVSIDGTVESHDRHRRFPNGEGSYHAVRRALELLSRPRYRDAYAGLLTTVDVGSDPVVTYEELLRHRPPGIDFLLPHANWSTPPDHSGDGVAPYGEWLVAVFDRWYDAPRQETRIRLFEAVIDLVLGGSSRSEQVGLSPVAVAVVESDGAIEQVDSLKSTYPGACGTGLSVFSNPFDAALDHPGVAARQIGVAALADDCVRCPIHRICGGGHYAHRYRAGDGFRNPTVYCADMQTLITHARRRVIGDLTAAGR
jgi:uncharacterized protein